MSPAVDAYALHMRDRLAIPMQLHGDDSPSNGSSTAICRCIAVTCFIGFLNAFTAIEPSTDKYTVTKHTCHK